MYHILGFNVTSIEFLPLITVERSIKAFAPEIVVMNGDGRNLVPEAVTAIKRADPNSRIVVIFDGEKRFDALGTWKKIH